MSEVLIGDGEIREVEPKKKLFISCPMKGRNEIAIKRSMEMMHKIAESYFGEELEVLTSYIEHCPPETANQAVWYLGRSLQILSEADYFIGIEMDEAFRGCNFENLAVKHYMNIPRVLVNIYDLMPGAAEVSRTLSNKQG